MRKITHRPIWLTRLVVVATLLVFSCNQENNIEPLQSPLDQQNSDYALAESILTPFAKAALKFSTDPQMNITIHNEVNRQFDGDFNVLFETIISPILVNGRSSSVLSETETEELASAVAQLAHIDDGLYPQIYIPFFENHYQSVANSSGRSASENTSPIIVIYTGDEAKEEWPGYQLDLNGELHDVGFLIDEDYAEQNEVWVISFNERVENGEVVATDVEKLSNGRVAYSVSGSIYRLDFQCRKESWTSGKHDIHIRRYTTWYAANEPGTNNYGVYNRLGDSAPTGDKIADISIKKDDVKNGKWRVKYLNYNYTSGWDTNNGNYMAYVIFEKDEWPAAVRLTERIPIPGTSSDFDQIKIEYRSYDTDYIAHYIADWQSHSYYAENSCIRIYCQ